MTLLKNTQLFNPIVKIFYAKVPNLGNEIDEIIENSDKTVSVNFNPGYDWKEIYSTRETINYEEPPSNTDDGKQFAQKLTFSYPGSGKENFDIINDLDQIPLLLRIKYNDGTSRLLGTIENPTFILNDFSTQGYVTDTQLTFLRTSEKPSPYLI